MCTPPRSVQAFLKRCHARCVGLRSAICKKHNDKQNAMKKLHSLAAIPVWALGMLLLPWQEVAAQQQERSRIYTCVVNGRTLTSDRPIRECIDREQRILDGVTGHQQGTRAPSYTEEELKVIRAREQALKDEQRRVREQRQRERVLMARYPDEKAHNAARESAKQTLRDVIKGGELRLKHLAEEKQRLQQELEFYQGDMKKAPAILRRQFQTNQKETEEQQRFIDGKREEETRIDRQFDAELEELKRLWVAK